MRRRVRALSLWGVMRLALLSLLLLVLTAQLGFAQRSLGYGFVAAPSGPEESVGTVLHYGIGGAAGVSSRVAFGGEIGLLHGKSKAALGSVNLTVHLRSVSRSERLDPFLTGGLSVGYVFAGRHQARSLVNMGAGLHYWFRPRLAVRTEARLYVPTAPEGGLGELRLGIVR